MTLLHLYKNRMNTELPPPDELQPSLNKSLERLAAIEGWAGRVDRDARLVESLHRVLACSE